MDSVNKKLGGWKGGGLMDIRSFYRVMGEMQKYEQWVEYWKGI